MPFRKVNTVDSSPANLSKRKEMASRIPPPITNGNMWLIPFIKSP